MASNIPSYIQHTVKDTGSKRLWDTLHTENVMNTVENYHKKSTK